MYAPNQWEDSGDGVPSHTRARRDSTLDIGYFEYCVSIIREKLFGCWWAKEKEKEKRRKVVDTKMGAIGVGPAK